MAPDGLERYRAVCEAALSQAGLHLAQGQQLWEVYRWVGRGAWAQGGCLVPHAGECVHSLQGNFQRLRGRGQQRAASVADSGSACSVGGRSASAAFWGLRQHHRTYYEPIAHPLGRLALHANRAHSECGSAGSVAACMTRCCCSHVHVGRQRSQLAPQGKARAALGGTSPAASRSVSSAPCLSRMILPRPPPLPWHRRRFELEVEAAGKGGSKQADRLRALYHRQLQVRRRWDGCCLGPAAAQHVMV